MRDLIFATTLISILLLAGLVQAGPANAPDNATVASEIRERYKRNLELWRKMTPEQQQRLRERHERWRNMSPDERRRIRKNFRRFRRMKQARRHALLRARNMMSNLEPKMREELRGRMHWLRRMPPEVRQRHMQRLRAARELLKEEYEGLREFPPHSPEARRHLMQLRMMGKVLHRLRPEQMEQLKNLPSEERREAIRKLVDKMRQEGPPHGERHGRPGLHRGGPERRNRRGGPRGRGERLRPGRDRPEAPPPEPQQ